MLLKYINRSRNRGALEANPISQLVNVPQLQQYNRCQFCDYWRAGRTAPQIEDCIERNKCGHESLLWAVMQNDYNGGRIKGEHFTPADIVKLTKINKIPRYVQFFSSDLSGYECNSLCQFYPSRIADEKSIADCANTNACGMNGSFWNILHFHRYDIPLIADFVNTEVPDGYILTYDGSLFPVSNIQSLSVSSDGLFVITDVNNEVHRIINMMSFSPAAGNFLTRLGADSALWLFYTPAVAYQRAERQDLCVISWQDTLFRYLVANGFDTDVFDAVYPDLERLSWSSSVSAWFTSDDAFIVFHPIGDVQLVALEPVGSAGQYVFQLGAATSYYLTAPMGDLPPAKWRKSKLSEALPDTVTVITVTDYNSSVATWLRTIGVRENLFYAL